MAVKSKLTQGGDGTAIPAGMVNEVKTVANVAVTSTYNGAWQVVANVTGCTQGLWRIESLVSYYVTLAGTGVAAGRMRIRDNVNNVVIQEASQIDYTATNAGGAVSISGYYLVPTGNTVNLSVEVLCEANSGTPTGSTMTSRAIGNTFAHRLT